jgi:DNA-binding SARP family transcriptional activator/Flp pilus assembly protein TadD
MAPTLEFGLLGPLMVRCDGVPVTIQRGKQRVLLALLLLNAGQLVPVGELAETLWGAAPPPSASVTLRNYVKRLRHSLGETGRARISTYPGGYVISLNTDELDVARFHALLQSARAAARQHSWEIAAGQSRVALSLWRGPPLADVESEMLVLREAARLEEMRLQTVETCAESELYLGRHADLIPELRHLANVHPLRERLHVLLMVALYHDGRQAEALAAFQAARRTLAEDLGAEPGPELRELHQQILRGDTVLEASRPAPQTGTVVASITPRELPAPVQHFVGRTKELKQLARLMDGQGETPGAVVISAIGGTAGVGKTALAVHWAHQASTRFPDGQIYLNLRGYDPDQRMPAAEALARLLRSLGLADQDIPAEEEERAARYRTLVAGRRILVLLDNAGEVDQVRPLLPAPPGVVLVTSRDSLAGLVAREGARRLDLDLLPPADAAGLLRALIGARVDADPAATAALAEQCCQLPLALRLAAELAVSRPGISLADLVRELADQQRRIDLFDAAGDPRTAVRAVFSWSYQHLDTDAARAFRLVALHPGTDVGLYAVAALIDGTAERAGRLLDLLARAHLIQPVRPGRYGMHDLLRAYALGLTSENGHDEWRTALTRLFDHYLCAAATAMDALFPAESHRRPRISPSGASPPPMGPDAARKWLDTERANLAATARNTADSGWPDHTIRLAATLFRYLDVGGHYTEGTAIHRHARRAARTTGDRAAEAIAVTNLATIELRQGRNLRATGHLQEALALFAKAGDHSGRARTLSNLGIASMQQGRYEQATGYFSQALALFSETGDQTGQARAQGNLGLINLREGSYQQANWHLQQTLALCRQARDPTGQAYALRNLGGLNMKQGYYEQAIRHLQQALALFRETRDPTGEAYTLSGLGDVYLRQGNHQPAVTHHRQALTLFRELGDRPGEAEALNGLGEILSATGHPGHASAQHMAALDIADQINDQLQRARAREGISNAHHERRPRLGSSGVAGERAPGAERLIVRMGEDTQQPAPATRRHAVIEQARPAQRWLPGQAPSPGQVRCRAGPDRNRVRQDRDGYAPVHLGWGTMRM